LLDRDYRGVLAFRPDSLAVISLSRDHLSARPDSTRDTDAVSVLTADLVKVISHANQREEELILNSFNVGSGERHSH